MIRIILLLVVLVFMADITAASPRISLLAKKKNTAKTVLWKTGKLRRFIESLEKECSFDHLNEVYKDLKGIWLKALTEGNTETLKEMEDLSEFLKKLIDLYNKCSKERLNIDFDQQWEIYLKIFGKEYTAQEKEMRKGIFRKNKEDVEKHNSEFRNGIVSYSANLNHLSDWTDRELEMMNGSRPPNATIHGHSNVEGFIWRDYQFNTQSRVPAEVDWRTKGNYLSPVQFQGKCGSCYAIAGLGALEAYHKKRKGGLVRLSVQNILDCTRHLGNTGCVYGFTVTVFQYAHSSGIVSNQQYPYKMNASQNCRWKREHVVATSNGYFEVSTSNELALRNAIAEYGPVAAIITAKGLHKYSSGVFYTEYIGRLEHAVLVVGYGTDPEHGDYWIVKNSWGYWWGADGYARIARNKNNACRIATSAHFPYQE